MRKLVMACLCGGVYKAEDVVQDVPAAGFALELEDLSVAHGLLLSVHLSHCKYLSGNDALKWSLRTCRAPVTKTMMPSSAEGCASLVATLWMTWLKGRF
jgi:hypothetical protein